MASKHDRQAAWAESVAQAQRNLQWAVSMDAMETLIQSVQQLVIDAEKWSFPRELRNSANILFVWVAYGYGSLLSKIKLRGGNRHHHDGKDNGEEPFLMRHGISWKDSSRWQMLSRYDIQSIQWAIDSIVAARRTVTVSGVLRLVAQRQRHSVSDASCSLHASSVADLHAALERERQEYAAILATPGWPEWGTINDQMIRDWMALPIKRVAEKNAAVHVLTPDWYLDEAIGLIKAWGFRWGGSSVWRGDMGRSKVILKSNTLCWRSVCMATSALDAVRSKACGNSTGDCVPATSLRQLIGLTSRGPLLHERTNGQ